MKSISPSTDINYLGGDILLINGVNFGYNASAVQIQFEDRTSCTVTSCVMEQIQCQVERMTDEVSSAPGITISVNGVADYSFRLSLVGAVKTTDRIVPNSVSPVLKSEIDIYLSSSYTDKLVAENFVVTATSDDFPDYTRQLYVMSVDQDTNSIKIKFPGAYSGTYHLQVSDSTYGRFLSDILELKVHGTVTGISPMNGSKYGGTLITITGENFSYEPLDNPVTIGGSYCYVVTSSPTEITCRQDYQERDTGDNLLIVFLKTSEEAACDDEICTFSYTAPAATIDDITAAFNNETLT